MRIDAIRASAATSALALLLAGCRTSTQSNASVDAQSVSSATSAAPARPAPEPPLAGERVEIPAGAFMAGSLPGDPGRVPKTEPMLHEVKLGAFMMARLPYPNDPGKPALTGVSRSEAARLCGEAGDRLCTELEWEFACKGTESSVFSTGSTWDPRCADDLRLCASSFNVLGLGAALQEWTASDLSRNSEGARAAVRGAARGAAASEHRCATRRGLEPSAQADDLGFRCCRGAPNAAVIAEPTLGVSFERAELSVAQLEALLGAEAETRALAKDVKFFREPEAAETVVQRGDGDRQGFQFTVAPLFWNPVAGARYLLVSARAGNETSFVVAYHVLDQGRYKLAASFVLQREAGPIAFAYSPYIRPRLHFSSCWGCLGETGKVLYRDPDQVVLLQP